MSRGVDSCGLVCLSSRFAWAWSHLVRLRRAHADRSGRRSGRRFKERRSPGDGPASRRTGSTETSFFVNGFPSTATTPTRSTASPAARVGAVRRSVLPDRLGHVRRDAGTNAWRRRRRTGIYCAWSRPRSGQRRADQCAIVARPLRNYWARVVLQLESGRSTRVVVRVALAELALPGFWTVSGAAKPMLRETP